MAAALEPLVANAAEILEYLEAACRGSAVVLAGDGRCGKTTLAQRVTLRHLAAGGSVVVVDLRRDLAVGLHGALPRGPAHFRDYRTAALNLLDPELFPNLQWVTETLAGAFWGGSRIPAETGAAQEMLGWLVRTLGWRNMRQLREGDRRQLLTASDLLRLVSDLAFREAVVAGIADTGAAHWWECVDRCGGLNPEVAAALQARLGILSFNPVAAAALGNGEGDPLGELREVVRDGGLAVVVAPASDIGQVAATAVAAGAAALLARALAEQPEASAGVLLVADRCDLAPGADWGGLAGGVAALGAGVLLTARAGGAVSGKELTRVRLDSSGRLWPD